jgi:hypothetical protein
MPEYFENLEAAEAYVRRHDADASRYSRPVWTARGLRPVEERMLKLAGGQRIAGGPVGKDELVASILDLSYPHIAEARAVIARAGAPASGPGSETVTFTFPGGVQVTVPPMAEDPRVTAPLAMTDEEILKLVQEDSSSDYNEGVGEFGGYVDWNVRDGILTVTVRAYTAQADDDPAGPLVRQWRLVRVDEPEKQPLWA